MVAAVSDALALTIRPLTLDDVPEITPIEQEAFPELTHGTPWQTELESKLSRYLVATFPGSAAVEQVAGYVGLWFVLDEAHITSLAVRIGLRRQGIARRLVMAAVGLALERDCILLTLEVRASNSAAQELYRTLGMRKVGVRRGYYSDNREDAWLMTVEGLETPAVRESLETLRQQIAPEIPPFVVRLQDDD